MRLVIAIAPFARLHGYNRFLQLVASLYRTGTDIASKRAARTYPSPPLTLPANSIRLPTLVSRADPSPPKLRGPRCPSTISSLVSFILLSIQPFSHLPFTTINKRTISNIINSHIGRERIISITLHPATRLNTDNNPKCTSSSTFSTFPLH